jgi:hypothetical protein
MPNFAAPGALVAIARRVPAVVLILALTPRP